MKGSIQILEGSIKGSIQILEGSMKGTIRILEGSMRASITGFTRGSNEFSLREVLR